MCLPWLQFCKFWLANMKDPSGPAFELYKQNLNQAASDMVRPFCKELLEACSDKASPEVCALCPVLNLHASTMHCPAT